MNMRIALVGYMAAGKNYWGKRLAERLEVPFLDLDEELEKEVLHMPIPEFISTKGELAFRKQERHMLTELSTNQSNIVLATGGGTPCYYDNMEVLKQAFTTVYLDVSIKTLADRLKENRIHRPLISHVKDDELKEFVAKHLFERRVFYSQAKIAIHENDLTLDELIARIEYATT